MVSDMKIYCNTKSSRDILTKLIGKDVWVFAFLHDGYSCDRVWVKVIAAKSSYLYQVQCYFVYSKTCVDYDVYPDRETAILHVFAECYSYLEIPQSADLLSTTELTELTDEDL